MNTQLTLEGLDSIADRVMAYRPKSNTRVGKNFTSSNPALKFYEFFAGGGMARAGLGHHWNCLFANDFDFKKSAIYAENWGQDTIQTNDVGKLSTKDLPGRPSLVWASFPCQDLSLAGMGAGLKGDRSGTFWPFWRLMTKLQEENRAPKVIVLENVCGTLTSHGGKDFAAIADSLSKAKYKFGAMVVDASEFVPHSRPRLFIVAVDSSSEIPSDLYTELASPFRHTRAVRLAYAKLDAKTKKNWLWWKLPLAPKRTVTLADVIEKNPLGVKWHSAEETERILSMMSPLNARKVAEAKASGKAAIGAIYKRTRHNENGIKVQRAEVRFDGLSGCLRTSAGGSSRQIILFIDGDKIRSRLISIRETARLMGLPDNYNLPKNYNEGYHLTGDGVVVPVVRHIASNLLEPLLAKKNL